MPETNLPMSFKAGGNIYPSRFVKISGEHEVTQCDTSGETAFGIAQMGQKLVPLSTNSTYAATSGDEIAVFTEGNNAYLELSGSVSAGNKLKPDANGKGLAITGGDDYAAIALEDGTADALIRVRISLGETA